MKTADVVVVGAGAMGSAAAYQLAKRGLATIAIDRFSPPHDRGSTHGVTRLTREAIGEGDAYVPFVRRSHTIWREIEAETGDELLLTCGTLVVSCERAGPAHGKPHFLRRTIEAARRFAIPHESLDAAEVSARYPQIALRGDESGYFEPGGGLVHPERCIAAQLSLARRHGADIRTDETVQSVDNLGSSVRVTTDRDVYEAGYAIMAAGSWLPELIGSGTAPLTLHRQIMFWYAAEPEAAYRPDRFPSFIWFHGEGQDGYLYGFPALADGRGVKVATEIYRHETARPEELERRVAPDESGAMHDAHVRDRLPGVTRTCTEARACLYTTTPDSDFIIDRHPGTDRIVLVSACSGHGFKHSAAIGETVAELVAEGRAAIDLSAFALSRFDRAAA